jgi:hypothetical protein
MLPRIIGIGFYDLHQCCGPGSGLDPDSMTLWIRIRNSDAGSGSRGKKIKNYMVPGTFYYIIFKFLTKRSFLLIRIRIRIGSG